jgi:hypothetical protein
MEKLSYYKHLYRSLRRAVVNRSRFGDLAPRYAECLWIDAIHCQSGLERDRFYSFYHYKLRPASGRVVSAWPQQLVQPIEQFEKIHYCLRHWVDGLSWRDAGAYDYMLEMIAVSVDGVYDQCTCLDDIKRRYEYLDRLYDHVERHGLAPRGEIVVGTYREVGGSIIHLGPDAVPCFGGAGYHRFAIARALKIRLPAQIGCVHVSALNRLAEFRCSNRRNSCT